MGNVNAPDFNPPDREQMPYGKVLVADYMQTGLDVACLLLNPYKLEIETAGSGSDVIQKIQNNRMFDIVFINDRIMGSGIPEMIRGLGYSNTLIALTGGTMPDGYDGVLSMPIDMIKLDGILNKYIRDKQQSKIENFISGLSIPGLDTAAGLALYNGDCGIYLQVIRSFVNNSLEVIEKLRFVTKETINEYGISVHGLKGICAGIGAENLRQAAYELELMAKSDNLAGILEKNSAFVKDASDLTIAVQAALAGMDNANPKPVLECPDPRLLAALGKCCEAFDMKGCDEIMDRLESAEYKNNGQIVVWLREKINALEFQEAAQRISGMEDV